MVIQVEIIINGKKINYEVEGEGKPVVILHGWLASLETMKPLQNYLANKFKVYNVDVIGFGKSELPNEPMNTNDFGDFLKQFLEKLDIKEPILIGHSNGGKTIINYAGRNLGKINKIVLIDSTGIKPKRKPSYYFKVYTFKCVKNIVKILPKKCEGIRKKALNKFGSADYKASPEVLRKTMNIILNEGQEKIMPNINAPTLLIWGENDEAVPLNEAKELESLLFDGALIVLPGTHYCYLENLRQVENILNNFL